MPMPGMSLQDAEDALDAAVAEFLAEGIDPDQFARIKMQLRASQIYAQDSVQRLARRYGSGLTSGLTIEDIEAWPDILQAVTEAEVMAAAERIFDRRRAVTGWLQKPAAEEDAAGVGETPPQASRQSRRGALKTLKLGAICRIVRRVRAGEMARHLSDRRLLFS